MFLYVVCWCGKRQLRLDIFRTGVFEFFHFSIDGHPSVQSCLSHFSNTVFCFEKLSCCIATNVFVLCNILCVVGGF